MRPNLLAAVGGVVALVGGLASAASPAVPPVAGALGLLAGIALVAVAALAAARAPAGPAESLDRFGREAARHGAAGALLVVVFLLLLVDVLAAIAGAGDLFVQGAGAVLFVRVYGVVLGVVVLAISGLLRLADPARPPLGPRALSRAYAGLGLAAVAGAVGAVTSLGVLPAFAADRAPFVLTASAAGLFYAVRTLAGLPNARQTIDWLEHEERIRGAGLPRKLVLTFASASAAFVLASIVAGVALDRQGVAILATAGAMLCVLLATFSLGVTRTDWRLEEGVENVQEVRRKRRIVLTALTLSVDVVMAALFVVTFLAGLAQAGGVALFASLLGLFVANYPIVVAVALLPLLATCVARLQIQSDVPYTDQLKAVTILAGGATIVLVFFGAFVGSGLAQGTAIGIENAVLLMSGAALALGTFVHARAQLPGILHLARQEVAESKRGEADVKDKIQRKMLGTYVTALVFVVGFVGFFAATTLGVVDVESGVFVDTAFFGYLLIGLVLLGLVVLRYLQGVNLDPAWRKEEDEIGKRRLTSAELHRYLILGVSGTLAAGLLTVGVLVQLGTLSSIGPLAVDARFATDFFVFALLIGLGPYGLYYNREQNRIRAIDAKFPEFLRDLAESQRSGMTLTEAVMTAAKGSYGALTPEIRKMSSQIEWGVSFPDALRRFSKRVRTPLIERTVALIIQASEAGGNVVDVLTAAADDSREIQQIVKERTNSMAMYVYIIYIAFGVFLAVIGVLNAQFIPEVSKAVAGAKGATVGGITFAPFDEQAFKTLFFHAAIIQALGGGFVAGVMQGGKPIMGLRHAFILVLVGYVVFRFVIGA